MKLINIIKLLTIVITTLFITGCGSTSSSSEGSSSTTPPSNPSNPPPPTNPSDILDYGYAESSSDLFIDVWGNNYYYKINGCKGSSAYGQFYYEVQANNMITLTFDTRYVDGEQSTCSIDKKFIPVTVSDGNVNGSRLQYNLFYDNTTGIYYSHDGYIYTGKGDKLVKIINNGQTGVVEDDRGDTVEVFIERAYKEVPLN